MNRPSRLPYVLLGLMTLTSFGGPALIAFLLSGGPRRGWPPDRPIEWIGAGLVLLAFAACFTACLTVGWWHKQPTRATDEADGANQDR